MTTVYTAFGPVRGRLHPLDNNVRQFLGIPYAAAPIQDLYLQAPVAHEGWDGVFDATSLPPTPQRRPYSPDSILIDPSVPGDEILNLNIFTLQDAKDLPVLVWIHGGGFKSGVAASALTDGRKFAAQGIVFVSISYRLGFEGFGWLSDAPANRGFLDQQAALRWVRDNISAFGGDPKRITISGQSAGGGSVLAHLTSPSSQGLFDRAISESGVLPPMHELEARRRAQMVGEYLATELTVEGIKANADKLVEAEIEVEKLIYEGWPGASKFVADRIAGLPMSDLPFTPWVDGNTLPVTVMEGVSLGTGSDKPLLLTVTSEEFTDILAPMKSELDRLDARSVLLEGGLQGVDEYISKYPRASTTSLLMGQLVSDAIFVWPALEIMRRRDQMGAAHTAMYMFDWAAGHDDPTVDALQQWSRHCIDIPFAFNLLEEPMARPLIGDNPPKALATQLHGKWVAFTKGEDVAGNY